MRFQFQMMKIGKIVPPVVDARCANERVSVEQHLIQNATFVSMLDRGTRLTFIVLRWFMAHEAARAS